ncbi:hypothetical protein, partial [Methylobacterium bullatum]
MTAPTPTPPCLGEQEAVARTEATPEQIAVAWATWHSRHGGKLGPGPAFREAINAVAGPLCNENETLRA